MEYVYELYYLHLLVYKIKINTALTTNLTWISLQMEHRSKKREIQFSG